MQFKNEQQFLLSGATTFLCNGGADTPCGGDLFNHGGTQTTPLRHSPPRPLHRQPRHVSHYQLLLQTPPIPLRSQSLQLSSKPRYLSLQHPFQIPFQFSFPIANTNTNTLQCVSLLFPHAPTITHPKLFHIPHSHKVMFLLQASQTASCPCC